MGKVVLLTGAPATGKSTLRNLLSGADPALVCLDYGQLLMERKEREHRLTSYAELRERSAAVVSPDDVLSVDEELIARVARIRQDRSIVIDSHAVTREVYGFRAVPFSSEQLSRLQLSSVVVLRCDPETTLARLASNADGRQAVSIELAREHQALQEGIATAYAIQCGCPIYFFDSGVHDPASLQLLVAPLLTN